VPLADPRGQLRKRALARIVGVARQVVVLVRLAVRGNHGRVPAAAAEEVAVHGPRLVLSCGHSLQVDPLEPVGELPVGKTVPARAQHAAGLSAPLGCASWRIGPGVDEPLRLVGAKRSALFRPGVSLVHRGPHDDLDADLLGVVEEPADQRAGPVPVVRSQRVHLLRLSAPRMAVGDPVDAAFGKEVQRFHVSCDRLLRVGALLHFRVPAAGHRHQPEPGRTEDGRGHGHHGVRLGLQGKVLRSFGPTRRRGVTGLAEGDALPLLVAGTAPVDPEVDRLADELLPRGNLQARRVAQRDLPPVERRGVEGHLHPREEASFGRAAEEGAGRLTPRLAPEPWVTIGDDPQIGPNEGRPAQDDLLQSVIAVRSQSDLLLREVAIRSERVGHVDRHRAALIAGRYRLALALQ